ncbi:P-loop containing nucleoside triphosphate hydrolase protein [Biscogniauxia mediterranea]|nr:P-loop containing nucleoside triphosphate hydrolase protein [Biscogniauxia mediterranea]
MSRRPAPVTLIAVMGLTGTGKTSFINKLTGANLETSSSLKSCTKSISSASLTLEGRTVILIDSPGFDDTEIQDADILKEFAEYLRKLNDKSLKLTGLLYFHNISHVRMGQSAAKNIRMFRALVGDGNMHNVVLVSTRWDLVNNEKEDIIKERITELESDGGFWGDMMKAGARHDTLKDVETDGRRIISRLMKKDPVEVKMQSELRDGISLSDTKAGKTLHADLNKMEEKYKKDMEDLKEQLEQAIREKQDFDAAILKKELEQARQDKEKYHQQVVALKDAEIDRLKGEVSRLSHPDPQPCIVM